MIKWTRPKKEKGEDDTDSMEDETDPKVSLRKKTGELSGAFVRVKLFINDPTLLRRLN